MRGRRNLLNFTRASCLCGRRRRLLKARQRDCEATAARLARALSQHSAVMRFHKTLHQGQTQTQAAVRSGLRPVLLPKTIEDKREKVVRDPLTGILDADDQAVFLLLT